MPRVLAILTTHHSDPHPCAPELAAATRLSDTTSTLAHSCQQHHHQLPLTHLLCCSPVGCWQGKDSTFSVAWALDATTLPPPPAPCNREPPPRCSSYSILTLCQSSCSHPPTAPYLSLEGPDSFFPTVTSSQNAIHMQMNSRGFAHPIATPNTLRYIPCPSESEVQIIPP